MDWIREIVSSYARQYPTLKIDFWIIMGFIGQALFTMRFLVQWVESERKKTSVIPVSFWYFSLAGGLTLLIYAVHRQDPVFILAYLPGNVIYFRNLYLIRKKKHRARLPGVSRESSQLTG